MLITTAVTYSIVEVIKKFSPSLLLRTGSTGYQLLHKNMPEALPSLSTVQLGEFAFDQLSVHLESYNAPRIRKQQKLSLAMSMIQIAISRLALYCL